MWHDPAVSLGLDPQALRLAAEPPFVLNDDGHIVDRQTGAERREPLPSEQAAHASTITQPIDTATLGDTILERVMTALAPYLTAITDLTATANGGGSNQGEPASNNPPPSILPALPPCPKTCLKLVWHSTMFRPSQSRPSPRTASTSRTSGSSTRFESPS
jgi:hypothetical protein